MAKLEEKPITVEDLSEHLKSTDDFAFELDVYRLCHNHDQTAQHGGTYTDPVTKLDRQYDIRMEIRSGKCAVRMAVECKNLKDYYPLLVSRVPRRQEESYHQAFVHTGRGVAKFHYDSGKSIYAKNQHVGKSTTQVGRRTSDSAKNAPTPFLSGDEEVYGKWTQAIASANDLVKYTVLNTSSSSQSKEPEGFLILPVLVVPDGTLWVADYLKDGTLKSPPGKVDECTFYIGKNIRPPDVLWTHDYFVSHLHFYTKTGFEKFLKSIEDEDYWQEILPGFPNEP